MITKTSWFPTWRNSCEKHGLFLLICTRHSECVRLCVCMSTVHHKLPFAYVETELWTRNKVGVWNPVPHWESGFNHGTVSHWDPGFYHRILSHREAGFLLSWLPAMWSLFREWRLTAWSLEPPRGILPTGDAPIPLSLQTDKRTVIFICVLADTECHYRYFFDKIVK